MRKIYFIVLGIVGAVVVLFAAMLIPGNGLGFLNSSGDRAASEAVANSKVDSNLEKQVLQIIRDNPEVILESVQRYQQGQQQAQVQQARKPFFQELKSDRSKIIGASPTLGAANAKVVLIEFSDFQCPFCARAHETVKEFMEQNSKEVLLVYKHLPLAQIHPEAIPAAEASVAAQKQGKFWEYHDALFENQDKLGDELYLEIAGKLNLNISKFNSDRASAKEIVDADVNLARQLLINGTPTFFMNEETFAGAVNLTDLELALKRATK